MGTRIAIQIGSLSAQAELNDSDCARRIVSSLPIESTARTWGQEVYCDVGGSCPLAADAREDVEVGDVGYWPTGTAMCFFFGATPASGPDGRPRAASAVNLVGRIAGDPCVFRTVRGGQKVRLALPS